MQISYCTTVCGRLWQLEQTLPTNVEFTKVDEVEICILAYNDATVKPYLEANYSQHLADGRIKVLEVNSEKPFGFSHTKNKSHQMATGEILFNLDADNFIANAHEALLKLKAGKLLVQTPNKIFDGRSGRIGVYKTDFEKLKGYDSLVDKNTDGEFILKAVKQGFKLVLVDASIKPIPNTQ